MTDSTTPQDAKAMSPASTGSVCEPVAWLVTGDGYEYATLLKEHAEVIAEEEDGVVVPLYRHPQPTLTDAERDVIEWCRQSCRNVRTPHGNRLAATLRGLLERTGGGR